MKTDNWSLALTTIRDHSKQSLKQEIYTVTITFTISHVVLCMQIWLSSTKRRIALVLGEAGAAQWLSVGFRSRRSAFRRGKEKMSIAFISFLDKISIHGMA